MDNTEGVKEDVSAEKCCILRFIIDIVTVLLMVIWFRKWRAQSHDLMSSPCDTALFHAAAVCFNCGWRSFDFTARAFMPPFTSVCNVDTVCILSCAYPHRSFSYVVLNARFDLKPGGTSIQPESETGRDRYLCVLYVKTKVYTDHQRRGSIPSGSRMIMDRLIADK